MSLKLSTKGRYGLRAMIDLAGYYGEGPVLVRSVAERQGISSKYLHALLASLKSAGLVRSLRGSGGGYSLAKAPDTIRVSEILEALEGPVSIVDCVNEAGLCERAQGCVAREIWGQLNEAIENVLEGLSLQDLLTRQEEKNSENPPE